MKALVIYDAGGNTEQVAKAICSGMKQMGSEVECKSAGSATSQDFQNAELWAVGSKVGFMKPSGKLKRLIQEGSAGGKHKAFAFDAREAGAQTGAADRVKDMLSASGVQYMGSTYFSTNGKNGPLMDGEENMAVIFGKYIGQM